MNKVLKFVRKLNTVRQVECPRCCGFAGHFEGDEFVECHRCWATGEVDA